MTERVQCAECERFYDSDEHPFCPRCGATAKADPSTAARSLASRSDPRRRRVQIAGVVMVSTGILVFLMGIAMIASAGSVWGFATDLNSQEGSGSNNFTEPAGIVNVTVLDGGVPVEGAMVTLSALQTNYSSTIATDANGLANFGDVMHLILGANIQHGDVDWNLEFMAMGTPGRTDGAMILELELSDQSVVNGPLVTESMLEKTTMIFGAGSILLGISPILGGVSALRLKNQQMAFFGAVVGAIPWLFVMVATMMVPFMLMLGLFIMAAVFVRQGRDLFV